MWYIVVMVVSAYLGYVLRRFVGTETEVASAYILARHEIEELKEEIKGMKEAREILEGGVEVFVKEHTQDEVVQEFRDALIVAGKRAYNKKIEGNGRGNM